MIKGFLERVRFLVGYSDLVLVPKEPTKAMLKAACAAMSPGKRPTQDWVNVKEKHRIRYRAMIDAFSSDLAKLAAASTESRHTTRSHGTRGKIDHAIDKTSQPEKGLRAVEGSGR